MFRLIFPHTLRDGTHTIAVGVWNSELTSRPISSHQKLRLPPIRNLEFFFLLPNVMPKTMMVFPLTTKRKASTLE